MVSVNGRRLQRQILGGVGARIGLGMVIAILLSVLLTSSVWAVVPYRSYVSDQYNGSTYSQYPYIPDGVYDGLTAGCGNLNDPQDLFVDSHDNLYIADSGNHRVVEWSTREMRVSRIIGDKSGPGQLRSPQGIFVKPDDGTIYVADKDRRAIVVYRPDGRFLKEYGEPTGELIQEAKRQGYQFQPGKVVVDRWGFLYVTVVGEYRGLAKLSPEGQFVGFFGATNTNTTWWDRFYRKYFMSQELAKRLVLQRPEALNNMALGGDGNIYTVNSEGGASAPPVRRLSPVGKDTMPPLVVGDPWYARNLINQTRSLVDVTVDKDQIFTVLDQGGNRIFQYDPQGNMIAVFGGRMDEGTGWGGVDQGFEQRGLFWVPCSIAQDSQGRMYVLDNKETTVTRFTLTPFGKLIHRAVALYNQGRYDEAVAPWQQVIEMDAGFRLAYREIGKALYRAQKYSEAMQYYQRGLDQDGYSIVLREYRQQWLRDGFGVIAPVSLLIIVWVAVWLSRRRWHRRRVMEEGFDV